MAVGGDTMSEVVAGGGGSVGGGEDVSWWEEEEKGDRYRSCNFYFLDIKWIINKLK